jgi:Ras-related GTP-binding protein C/D
VDPVAHPATRKHPKELFYPSSSTTITPATPGTTLTYHLITRNLALLAVIPTNVYDHRRGLLEYNVVFFREGVQEICNIEEESREGG